MTSFGKQKNICSIIKLTIYDGGEWISKLINYAR